MRKMKAYIALSLIMLFLAGCYGSNTVDWYESFRFTGTVEEILADKNFIVMKEYDAPESRNKGNIYEIPVDDIEDYETGNKLLIIVETNTPEDLWDLDHMRFEIKPVEN